jgi:hypothetical protein
MDIHITLGPRPANNFLGPSSATILFIVSTIPVYGLPPPSVVYCKLFSNEATDA